MFSTVEIEKRIKEWHEARFPNAHMENVALKMAEEVGEVASAINALVGRNSATGKGEVGPEVADVIIAAVVLISRWFPEVDIEREVRMKLEKLEKKGAHPASSVV
jgi:NTP pyrophosphatase (non-canonical NTP hydrolase)